ncbi:unnamed protein product [Caenorhabditis bovis]|uniref:Major facilitator superfamily (MFS) profile domain-containing protein n=1 Tax=Caenorhabditis bovis TaxID=2654633 RepID=A0A8S1EHL9_9PELO|nr:unnamed protein product [Caenorhabditis bovis]
MTRRASVRTRLRPEDISSWVEHNQTNFSPAAAADADPHFATELPCEVDDDESSESSLVEEPQPLDGGYAWVITFYSFMMHFILDGLSFTFGMIFPEIQHVYGTQRTGASTVASFFLSFPLIFAPIAGTVTDVFGCRFTIILGASICLVCGISSLFVTTIGTFAFIFGGGCGLGMAFCYNAAIVMVTYFFCAKRGIATSMAVSGTGTGTACYPFFFDLAQKYLPFSTLANMFVVINVSFFVLLIIGFLTRDVTWTSDTKEYKVKKFMRQIRIMKEEQEAARNAAKNELAPIRRSISMPTIPTNLYTRLVKGISLQNVDDQSTQNRPPRSMSVGQFRNREALPKIPEYTMLNSELEHLEHLDLELAYSPYTTINARKRMTSKTSMSADYLNIYDESANVVVDFINSSCEDEDKDETEDSDMSNDGDSSSSEISIHEKKTTTSARFSKVVSNLPNNGTLLGVRYNDMKLATISSAPNTARTNRTSLAPGASGVTGRIIAGNALQPSPFFMTNLLGMQAKMPSAPILANRKKRKNFAARLNMKLLKEFAVSESRAYSFLLDRKAMIALIINIFSLYLILDVPYVYFGDYVTEHLQFTLKEVAFMNSTIGIANFFFTILFGFISDLKLFKERLFIVYGVAMLFVVSSFVSIIYSRSFWSVIIVVAIYGSFVCSNYALQSILITIVFDTKDFQTAYSMCNFAAGLGSLIGPICIGVIRDKLESYKPVFAISTGISLISAGAAFLPHVLLKNEVESQKNNEDEVEMKNMKNSSCALPVENERLLASV